MFPFRSKARIPVAGLLAAVAAAVFAAPVAATPVTGRVSIRGVVTFSSSTIDFAPAGGGAGSLTVGGVLSGSFAGLNGTLGTITDLDSASEPPGTTVSPVTFLVFAANPDIVMKLTLVNAGIFGSAGCAAAPAAGQTCTPAGPGTGSAADLVNTGATGSTLSFSVEGTATRVSTGETSNFTGTFTTQFAGLPYQTILGRLGSGESVTAAYSADFVASVPAP